MKKTLRPKKQSRRRGRPAGPLPSSESLKEKLQALSDLLVKSLDLDRILDELLVSCCQAAASNRGAAFLLEADGQLSLRARFGYSAAAGAQVESIGQSGWVLDKVKAGEPVAVSLTGQVGDGTDRLLSQARLCSLLLVPLTLGKDCLGALALGSTRDDLSARLPLFSQPVRLQLGQATALARVIFLSAVSEQKFRDLVQGLDAIVWEADPLTFQFSFVSRRAEEILGYPVEQWLTEPNFWVNHICQEDRKRAVVYCRKATSEGKNHEFEYRAVAADGRLVWLRDTVRVVRDEQGQVRQLRGLMVDITERKQAERQLEERTTYLDALLENSPLAIVVLDSEHHVRMVNPAFERLFLYRQEEILGTQLDEFIAPAEKTAEAASYTRRVLAGEVVHSTTRRRRKDGTEVEVELHGVPLQANGELIGVYGIYRDITERQRAERLQAAVYRIAEAAIASATLDDLYRAVHRTIQSVMPADNFYIAIFDDKIGLLSFPYFMDQFDKPPAPKPLGKGLTEYVLRTGKALLCTTARHEELERRGEVELLGTPSPIWLGVPLHEGEKTIGIMVVQHYSDPTAYGEREQHVLEYVSSQIAQAIGRKRVEEVLRLSEEKFSKVFRSTPDAISISTLAEGRYLEVNEGFLRLSGYGRDEIIGRTAAELRIWTDPKDRERLVARLRDEGRVHDLEFRFRPKSGEGGVGLVSAEIIELSGEPCLLAVVRDITERQRAEEAVRESEAKFRAVSETAASAIFVSQGDRFHYVNRAMEVITGYTEEELLSREFWGLIHPDFRELVRRRRMARLNGEAVIPQYEIKIIRKDGQERWVDFTASLIEYEAAPAVLGTAFDITERKQIEEALRRSEANYRSLVENAPYGICQISPEGRFLAVNPALVEMVGYASATELLGVNIATEVYRSPEEQVQLIEKYWSQERFQGVEVAWKRKNGVPITVRLGGRPVRDERGQVVYVEMIAENVTERRALEQQLRQAMKMEAVGRLAGGVAHDFNNLLMVIRGHSELLRNRLGSEHPLLRNAQEIDKAAERAASLTQQLLAFSRKQMLQPRVLDLNAVVADLETMLRRLIGEDIELATVPSPSLGRVKADPGQIEQVVLNLAVNARDAMPGGGKLVIETANMELDEVYASQHPGARAGSYVMLAVSDSGVGMDAETQAHVFEPFFTTKEKGRGTGLGLAMVYGIVKQSDGYIWVYSEPGRGTSFKIFLPRVEEAVVAARPAQAAAAPRGTETILLVEDEVPLRKLAREFLESNGYHVLEAATGVEALSVADGYQGTIHLLMTDVVMPGMGGRELAEKLTGKRPETKVLYMSGYTDNAIVRHGVLAPGVIFLQKPFTLDTLARKLREVLDAAPAG